MPRAWGGYRGSYRGGSSSRSANQPRRPRLTHFLCIPLVTESSRAQIENALARFKEQIIDFNRSAPASSVVPLTAIRPIDSIHLTLGVMSLESEKKIQEAVELLESLDLTSVLESTANRDTGSAQAVPASNLQISLQSLESMHDVRDTSVLYVQPTDQMSRLQPICESIRSRFIDKGLIVDENRPLRLHATVLNTVYSKAEVGTVKRLDATSLLEIFREFQWVPQLQIETVAICKMGAKKTFDSSGRVVKEAYEEIIAVPMP